MDLSENFDGLMPVDLRLAKQRLHDEECRLWKINCAGKPKLRTYISFKTDYKTELYAKLSFSRSKRSIMAQLRSGTLPLMMEVGRFRNLKIFERQCPLCNNGVEDETHFLFYCNIYAIERSEFFRQISSIDTSFSGFNSGQKLAFIMSDVSLRLTIDYVNKIFKKRQSLVYTDS